MGKLDKKVLKILKTRQFEDLDAEDIAMQIKNDEDDVNEALGSLKDQGLIESIERDGKKFWRLAVDEPVEKPMMDEKFDASQTIDSDTVSFDISSLKAQPAAKKEPVARKENPEATIDFFSVSDPIEPKIAIEPVAPLPKTPDPVKIEVDFPVLSKPEPVKVKPEIPAAPKPEPVKVKTEIPVAAPVQIVKDDAKPEKTYDHKDYIQDDETDRTNRSGRKASAFPVIGIAVAVVFSVVISAVIAMMVASNANKEVLGELEKKVSEVNAKQDQRIESLTQKITTIADQPGQSKTRAAASRSVKPAAAKSVKQAPKRTPPPKKKRSKSVSSNQESSGSSSPQESPPAAESSPSTEPAPAVETPPPASGPEAGAPSAPAEGSGQ